MSEDEALAKLKVIMDNNDLENRHIDGDELMVEFLKEQGFERLSEAYDRMTNTVWYA